MKKILKEHSGITLIALVITIVVLLILAGVSIAMLTGDNGILTQANSAKEETRGGAVQEARDLWKTNQESDKLAGTSTAQTLDELLADLKKQKQLTDEEIATIKETGEVTIGSRTIVFGTEGNKETIKILVNSGEDGLVILPIIDNENCEINWGDGQYEKANTIKREKMSNQKIEPRSSVNFGYEHKYSEKNKEYLVEISGEVTELRSIWHYHDEKGNNMYYEQADDKILEIVQWGETGLRGISLQYYENLRRIASPSEKSFENIDFFDYAFDGCTSLTSIPEDLFSSCPNVTDFSHTFDGCTSLTSIPEDLFSNCPNVTEFYWTFADCTSLTSIPEKLFEQCNKIEYCRGVFYGCVNLTGDVIPLWKRIENWESLDLNNIQEWSDKIPDGEGAYMGCTKVNNYELIPQYWKEEIGSPV